MYKRQELLLCDPDERWGLGAGLCAVADGLEVDADVDEVDLGLWCDLLSMLSTANGDDDIFGDDADALVISASLRKDEAEDFSEGSLVANCCCCCLEWLLEDDDDDDDLYEDEVASLLDKECECALCGAGSNSSDCFLNCESISIVRSNTEGKFGVELRLVVVSGWEATDGLTRDRFRSILLDLCEACSDD